jgi:hypothetical protein
LIWTVKKLKAEHARSNEHKQLHAVSASSASTLLEQLEYVASLFKHLLFQALAFPSTFSSTVVVFPSQKTMQMAEQALMDEAQQSSLYFSQPSAVPMSLGTSLEKCDTPEDQDFACGYCFETVQDKPDSDWVRFCKAQANGFDSNCLDL